MRSLVPWGVLSLIVYSSLASAQPDRAIRQITIRSGWGGLGTSQTFNIEIVRSSEGFRSDGTAVSPALVSALVSALEASRMAKPDMSNLGITQAWLKSQVLRQTPRSFSQATNTTPGQKALFEASFTDPGLVSKAFPNLWSYSKFDDYPGAQVEVDFQDGSKLRASTHSYYVFMIPWQIGGQQGVTFNADISRAVSALMPAGAVNKDRLAGAGLAKQLTDAVINSIETEWNLKGADEMVGGALAQLRQKYQIVDTEITPYHHPEYGTATYKGEENLHALLHRAGFPPNVSDAVVLRDNKGKVEGLDKFLTSAPEYENLALSVPWLSQYIHDHPKVLFRVSYVHTASFGDKAMSTFTKDMRLRGRQDLIEKVKAQQEKIALLIVGTTYSESYWLVFPDKHLLLWRYGGPSGLLKWNTEDFREGECADYRVNNGGCPGREITPDGELIPEGTPRDLACLDAWRKEHLISSTPPEALFEVEEHGRAGFIDRTGNIAIPLCFEGIQAFSEGLAAFTRDGRWGYIDRTGKIVIQPTFPWAEEFHEGLAHVQATGTVLEYDGRWGYIDKTGKMVIPAVSARMMEDSSGDESAFHEGLAMTEARGESVPPRKGFIDKTGKLVVDARFTYVYPFSEGLAAATESESGDTGWGFIDTSGNWAIPPRYDGASSFQSGLAPVNRKKDCGYIDKAGTQVLRLPAPGGKQDCASAWGEFNDGLSRWLFGAKYGFIDRSGKTIIAPQFDLTYGFSEGLAAVQIGKKWGYIDTTGKMVIEPQEFWNVKPFHDGLAEVQRKDNGVGYIDRSGKYVWGPHKRNDPASE